MSAPGFTAEAALFNSSERYQTEAINGTPRGGAEVVPQQFGWFWWWRFCTPCFGPEEWRWQFCCSCYPHWWGGRLLCAWYCYWDT